MKNSLCALICVVVLVTARATNDGPRPEKGPEGIIAYQVEVDASDKGGRIEAENEFIGNTPTVIKIFGDKDGTFHSFGKFDYRVTAYPISAELLPQTKVFKTGRLFSGEDRIPKKIFFEFGQPATTPRAGACNPSR